MTPIQTAVITVFAALSPFSAAATDYDAAARETRRLLTELVAADTSNPPGNEARAAAIGAARLKEAGIPFEVVEFAPGRQNLVARLKGAGQEAPLLLLAHTDVVGAGGQAWSSNPHQVVEKDGFLVGRGVFDDLGMASISLEVLLLLKRSGAPLRRDVILAWTGDEESGGAGIVHLLKARPDSVKAALALNESGGLVLAEDGTLKMVEVQTAEKTYQDFEVVARGPTGHSSVPQADNAIYRLSAALARLGGYSFPARLLPVTRAYFAKRAALEPPGLAKAMREVSASEGEPPAEALAVLDANPSLRALLRTTCVATVLSGGTRVNALPAEARANINCRILPDEGEEEVRRRLEAVLADPALEVRSDEDLSRAGPSPLDGPGLAAIAKVAGRMWPSAPIVPIMGKGATDSRFLRAAGIASYGINPLAAAEADARRMHGVDERIPAASLRTGVEFFHRLVLELSAK